MARSQGQWWIDSNYPPAMLQDPGIMTVDSQYSIEFNNLLSCAYQVIRYNGLPDSVDPTYFKMCLYLGGRVALFRDTKGDGLIRGLDCSTEDKPTIYYMPSKILIVNPTFKGYSYSLTPGEDVAVIFCRECDRYQYGRETGGMYGLISSTAQLLADNTVSINVATKNMRLTNILSANDLNTKNSIDIVIKKMYNGEPYVCVQSSLVDQLSSIPMTETTNTQQLLQLLQTRQYIYAHFYEQLGLKTHDQIKKERLITSEIDEGTELAIFNIQDMLAEIQRGIDEANRIFSLNITIELHPLIAGTLDKPEEAEPAGNPAPMEAADDQIDDAADPDPEELTASDPSQDFMQQIYVAAAERVAAMIRGQPADDQSEAEPDDDQSDGEPDDDQSDGEPDDDQSDGEPDDDQSDGEPDDDQSDGSVDVSIQVDGSVEGDIIIAGGDADGDNESEAGASQDSAG